MITYNHFLRTFGANSRTILEVRRNFRLPASRSPLMLHQNTIMKQGENALGEALCTRNGLITHSTTKILGIRSFAITGRKSKNVAGKKNKLDAMKTKLYTRLGIKIIMAAKAGGPDPGTNKDLARALKEAQTAKLPKENIDRALNKSSDTQAEDFKVGVYEVFGHGGVGILVVSLTDNTNRANNLIKAAARKAEVKMASSGSVLFSFNHKGVLRAKSAYSEDDALEVALDIGADNLDFISFDDGSDDSNDAVLTKAIVVDPEYLAVMQDALVSKFGFPVTGSLEYLPSSTVSISDEDYKKNLELIEVFEDIDDVDKVYHNIEDS